MRKIFVLSEKNKEQRYNFLKFLQKHNISPGDIFFTDESVFNLSFINGNCKIRITIKVRNNLKRGSQSAINLMVRPTPKKSLGIMVSDGISKNGLWNIILHSGNVNTFSYKQVLDYYKADCNNFKPKFFQQDGARVHSSKGSQKKIQELFGNDYIPT